MKLLTKSVWAAAFACGICLQLTVCVHAAEPRSIEVTGDAEIRVTPNEVSIGVGVETWDKDLAAAKKANDEKAAKTLEKAKSMGVKPEHLQTDYISVEPRYKDGYEKKDFIGYFVRKTIVIRLKDVSKFEDVLSAALESGVNYVHGIHFRTTEIRKYRDQARSMAVKAAREKAEAVAGELGQKVGKPLKIKEEHCYWFAWYDSWRGERWARTGAQNVMQTARSASPEVGDSISLGQISVFARMGVVFEIE
jgi:hypothetical protein